MILKVECVWCNSKTEFNRYVRSCDETSHVINYMDIVNKLAKADPYGADPNDNVVGLHLHSSLKNLVAKIEASEDQYPRLIYMLKNLTAETAIGLKETLEDLMPETARIPMKLVIINRTDYPKKGVLSRFDVVKFIDK